MAIPRIRLQFAQKLRRLRAKRGLTQEAMAEKAGMDPRYYQRLESKKPGAVKIDTIGRIAAALNTAPSELLKF